ncbi:hypothetical protein ACQ4PT_038342 [Festuca glaucescens]
MGRFCRALDDLELRELPLHGRRYTWSNERESPTLERLDRMFCSVDWEAGHPNCFLTCVATLMSDHCPLLLHTEVSSPQHRRFHFEPFWPQIPGFHETVQAAWAEPTHGNPITVLDHKLRNLGRRLKSWSDQKVGNIRLQIEWAKELVFRFDTAQEERQLSLLETWFRRELKKKYLGLCSLQRTVARQRSRINWLREGEGNTKYFHIHTNHRRRKNYIPQVLHNNSILVEQAQIEEAFAEHYEQLFSAPADREFSINFEAMGIPQHNLSFLDAEFDEEEVWAAIKDTPGDRAPGPDGFTGTFLKVCWQTIKEDIMSVFRAVRIGRAHGFAKLNRALITLLPKKPDASTVQDYRPISLVHCIAKLIAKTMSRCLAPVLPTLVSPNQSAFIKGRAIHDNFMLVQQLAKSFHAAKTPTVLLKLDIALNVGNGNRALFWSDRWIARQSISEIAPEVLAAINPRALKTRKVATALPGNAWIQDISGALSADGVIQFLHLVDLLEAQQLSSDNDDEMVWHLSASGEYSSKSAYRALFEGTVTSPHHSAIWDCWAPLKCKVVAWLASLDRCWTNQRRLRHELSDNDTCALCDQASESIEHLMIQCSFSQQVWFDVCSKLNLLDCMPDRNDEFNSWFMTATANAQTIVQKGNLMDMIYGDSKK